MYYFVYINNSILYMYNIIKIILCNMNIIVYILDWIGQYFFCVGDVGNNVICMLYDL